MKKLFISLILVLPIFLGACDYDDTLEGEEKEDTEGPLVCDPGETKGCFCVGNSDGVTVCKDDGSGWTGCDCSGVGADFGCDMEGIWFDAVSGLCWEEPVSAERELVWFEAIEYCRTLAIGGHDDWYLPDIADLRTLIRGCEATQTDGVCTDIGGSCEPNCGNVEDSNCEGCSYSDGPGEGGLYLDPSLNGFGNSGFWSTSTDAGDSEYAWHVNFRSAKVSSVSKNSAFAVSCVRSGM
ncbi:MAG: DUF1566 domain-containing protein [Deltaproteobacteria bacterium]|nr:DUF1566 domain-containing protein [Deltaproteobacteria bacterium]